MSKNIKIKNLIEVMENQRIIHSDTDILQANVNLDQFHDIIIYCLDHNIDYDNFVKLINMTCNFIDPNHLFEKELSFSQDEKNKSCLVLKIFNDKKFKDEFIKIHENVKSFYKIQETKQLFSDNNDFQIKIIN